MGEIIIPKGPDRVRKRSGIFFPGGVLSMVLDLIDYSVQEHQLGFADHIEVAALRDGSFMIEDNGSGLPIDPEREIAGWQQLFCGIFPREEGKFTFCVGSERQNKLREITGDHRLYISWCTHFAVCASSEFMHILTYHNGFEYKLYFEKGILVGEVEKTANRTGCGAQIIFKPDAEVFENVSIELAKVKAFAEEQMAAHPGLTITIREAI